MKLIMPDLERKAEQDPSFNGKIKKIVDAYALL
jgi:hypothetical protein